MRLRPVEIEVNNRSVLHVPLGDPGAAFSPSVIGVPVIINEDNVSPGHIRVTYAMEEEPPRVIDLMNALQESLRRAKEQRPLDTLLLYDEIKRVRALWKSLAPLAVPGDADGNETNEAERLP